jgi:murein DD-endopeptidase MepM/ murein hydrolase activator NlpD
MSLQIKSNHTELPLLEYSVKALNMIMVVLLLNACSLGSWFGSSGSSSSYIVQRGDTVSALALRSGQSIDLVIEDNSISDPDRLYPGQLLKLRGKRPINQLPNFHTLRFDLAQDRYAAHVARQYIGTLAHPIGRARLTSRYAPRRNSFHHGLDFATRAGEPIFAAHDGVVLYSGNRFNGFGNLIVLQSGIFYTVYAHNKRNVVQTGQRVSRGEEIAYVGATGRATGPHLHFEVRFADERGRLRSVNPELFYPQLFS